MSARPDGATPEAAALEAFARDFGRRTAIHLESCVRCGHCAEACHFFLATRDPKHTPIWKLEPFRRAWKRTAAPFAGLRRLLDPGPDVSLSELREWETLLFDACTMCGRCTAACPMGIDIATLVGQARHGLNRAGLVPPDLAAATGRAAREGSPLGATPKVLRERLEWLADEHDVAFPLDLPEAELLVTFSSVEIMKYADSLVATARILAQGGFRWTMSTAGYEATNFGMLAGDVGQQRAMTLRLIEAAIACGAKAVLLPECGHAYTALRWQGANMLGRALPFRVQHVTEFLAEQLEAGRIRVEPLEGTVAFHDPCQLVRRGGAGEAPRRVIRALGLTLVETEDHGELAFCCGGGGGVIANSRADGLRREAFRIKMRQIDATGAGRTLTSCANCRLTFDDGRAFHHWEREMGSLLELVAERLAA